MHPSFTKIGEEKMQEELKKQMILLKSTLEKDLNYLDFQVGIIISKHLARLEV